MNSRAAGSPRKTTSSPGAAVARVLHPDVVLVGEEVRDPVVDGVLAEHRPRRRRTLLEGVGPVLDAQAPEQRVVVVGDVARREDAVGARAQRGVDEDPVVDVEHALGQPRCAGPTPTPITTASAVEDGAVARAHALGAPVALDRLDAAAEVQRDAVVGVDVAVEGAELGAEDALERAPTAAPPARRPSRADARRPPPRTRSIPPPTTTSRPPASSTAAQARRSPRACAGRGRRRDRRPGSAGAWARRPWRAAARRSRCARRRRGRPRGRRRRATRPSSTCAARPRAPRTSRRPPAGRRLPRSASPRR